MYIIHHTGKPYIPRMPRMLREPRMSLTNTDLTIATISPPERPYRFHRLSLYHFPPYNSRLPVFLRPFV